MTNLHGKQAKEFVEWLDRAKHVLPGATTLTEAKEIFERKQQEESLRHEKQKD